MIWEFPYIFGTKLPVANISGNYIDYTLGSKMYRELEDEGISEC